MMSPRAHALGVLTDERLSRISGKVASALRGGSRARAKISFGSAFEASNSSARKIQLRRLRAGLETAEGEVGIFFVSYKVEGAGVGLVGRCVGGESQVV